MEWKTYSINMFCSGIFVPDEEQFQYQNEYANKNDNQNKLLVNKSSPSLDSAETSISVESSSSNSSPNECNSTKCSSPTRIITDGTQIESEYAEELEETTTTQSVIPEGSRSKENIEIATGNRKENIQQSDISTASHSTTSVPSVPSAYKFVRRASSTENPTSISSTSSSTKRREQTVAAAATRTTERSRTSEAHDPCKLLSVCRSLSGPVCGSDGKTYSNCMILVISHCHRRNRVSVLHSGSCEHR